jgi:hypothetical protein
VRETRQEKEARRTERERQARLKERERSMQEENVDGGFLVTLGTYIGPEDYSKPVVRQLQVRLEQRKEQGTALTFNPHRSNEGSLRSGKVSITTLAHGHLPLLRLDLRVPRRLESLVHHLSSASHMILTCLVCQSRLTSTVSPQSAPSASSTILHT